MADLLLPDFPYFHKFTYVISYSILVHIAMTVIIASMPILYSLRIFKLLNIRFSNQLFVSSSIFVQFSPVKVQCYSFASIIIQDTEIIFISLFSYLLSISFTIEFYTSFQFFNSHPSCNQSLKYIKIFFFNFLG